MAEEMIGNWREARASAQRQLDAFESGRMKFRQNGVDVSDRHIETLRHIVESYNLLLEAHEVK